jgi:hypothetical protein
MALDLDFLNQLQNAKPEDAWKAILSHAWQVCSPPLNSSSLSTEIIKRDYALADIDLFLASAGWDLWKSYERVVPLTSEQIVKWWQDTMGGKGLLILDGFSLRECPYLLAQAQSQGFTIHTTAVTGAELPADTTPFAKALGFTQRSDLSNNGAGATHRLPGARTESTDIPYRDCADLIGSELYWVFWHHWPDNSLHQRKTPGRGLASFAEEAETYLTSDDFWLFLRRLATGRQIVITSDHGYAASGNFPDSSKEQTEYLKQIFKSGRWTDDATEPGVWAPPIDLLLESRHGHHLFVNGRRKWSISAGYPTLTHGGLSVLEVAVPWIELSLKA